MNAPHQIEICLDTLEGPIKSILEKYPKSVKNRSDLISAFDKVIQDVKDPPLEIIWFYGAVAFHHYKATYLPPPAKLSPVKDLLQSLTSYSSSCSVVKRVAVLAPVLYLLYHLVIDFSERDPCLREDIGNLVEEIVSYISICCSQYLEDGEQRSHRLRAYVLDLIRVWTVDKIRPRSKNDLLAYFFPNLDDGLQDEVTECMRYMAGVVINETFLLRLYLKVSAEISKEDLHREMLKLAIKTIKGFQYFYFLDVLLKMLLEPNLPVASLLSPKDEIIMYKALYDAVLLIDYASYIGKWAQSSDNHSKNLALLWVLVAERGIQFARATNDEDRAVSYLNAFRESQLMAELISWAGTQAKAADQNNRAAVITSPDALINWLYSLEDEGIRVFNHSVSLMYAKAVSKVEGANGDYEMGEPSNIHFMNTDNESCRKRKEPESGPQESWASQVRRARLGIQIIDISSSSSDEDDDMEP